MNIITKGLGIAHAIITKGYGASIPLTTPSCRAIHIENERRLYNVSKENRTSAITTAEWRAL